MWGRNDPFFLPAGAEAYRCDIPAAEIHLVDAGHFPLETHLDEIAGIIRAFLAKTLDTAQGTALFGELGEATVWFNRRSKARISPSVCRSNRYQPNSGIRQRYHGSESCWF
ncbi:alpha/beta fold hydrolase [Paraburkholderia sp. 32]|uniref:alpha/beta fold hydrolase n=1 Tax=Paraburkholderia sp. 32 TaxID=2991057 RepID=UPI003D23FE59